MEFSVTILGNNSAIPANGRHPTSQVVSVNDQLFLVDCGEGTQLQMSRFKVRSSRIDHIFISHLHGDHYFGLIGLLNSFGLLGRTHPLTIYGPAPLEKIIRIQLEAANNTLPYDWKFVALFEGQNGILYQEKGVEIATFPTDHKIECHGFIFREKHEERKILPEKVKTYQIPYSFYQNLKEGADFRDGEGNIVRNDLLTDPPDRDYTYAFCADSRYNEKMIPAISGADLIYHESTYLDQDQDKAAQRYHSTASQAAAIAQKAGIRELLLGHFSSRYRNLDGFEKEAIPVFPRTKVTEEGCTYVVEKDME